MGYIMDLDMVDYMVDMGDYMVDLVDMVDIFYIIVIMVVGFIII